jgi:hypothetical protein
VTYIQITSLERERAVTNIVKYTDQDNIWASFVVAYEQNGSGKTYVTPFTEAGLIDAPPVDAPEPASLLLLGTGLLASGALSWRRRGSGFRNALFRRLELTHHNRAQPIRRRIRL